MIKKDYRLDEGQTKKVLKQGKPFFSYGIVVNYFKNDKSHNRFGIIIGKKSVKNNISRNFFRRLFFNLSRDNIFFKSDKNFDLIFTVKKQTILYYKDRDIIFNFEKDIKFLTKKVLTATLTPIFKK